MEKEIQLEFRLAGIELLGKRIADRKEEEGEIKGEALHYRVNSNIRVNEERKQVIALVDVTVMEKGGEFNERAFIKVANVFEIMNFKEVVTKQDDNSFFILPELVSLINSLTIGTCRGILFKELSGTYLHKAFLPIINLDSTQQAKLHNGDEAGQAKT